MTLIYDHACPHRTPQQPLEVDFALPDGGWILGRVRPLHDIYALPCTDIWDPFGDLICWLEQIADGSAATSWCIDHEGYCSRLQFYGANGSIDDQSDHLLHVETSGTIDHVRGVKVDRRQLVASFYRGFRAMAEHPAYSARQWERHPQYAQIEEMDEEAFFTELAVYPFCGLQLRTLRSTAIEAYLDRQLQTDRQLPLW